MDFFLTDERIMFRNTVRRFAQTELAPHAASRAREAGYPWDVARRMAEMGLMGIALPEAMARQTG